MSVVVVGCHERDASLDLLGRLAVGDDELPKSLRALAESSEISEAVILSTCLRTEVYAVVDRFHDGIEDIRGFFQARLGNDESVDLGALLTVAYEEAAASHLFEVAAGVDSVVLGEGEILRQVRHAHESAAREHVAGATLGGLFRHALIAGKRVRAETAIARGTTSISHIAAQLTVEKLASPDSSVIVLGSGEAGEGVARALHEAAPHARLTVASRARSHADHLASAVAGHAIALEQLADELAVADVLVAATSASEPLVGPAEVGPSRHVRPLLVVDAGVPRDVDPAVRDIVGVTLYDLDDLNAFAAQEMDARRAEVPGALAIVAEELEHYRGGVLDRSVAPLVAALRQRAEAMRLAEVERLCGHLGTAERAVVEEVSRRLVAKLLHEPTVQLKQAAGSPRGERLAEALRVLFDL